ncbi:serine/threonine-protein kinase [Limnoglobus roseus]|uniref:Tetratricopeptide repeat protein n=1 Tax=Limnoglobus roseus TaxID=2598579 RepID=A0A5C1ALF8_9BACT|nr:serine/threonine-protein kinase [Limnoglobus roseus]QEL18572.1 tetratricopeptide repeat protein [Limnoglobus roseus]
MPPTACPSSAELTAFHRGEIAPVDGDRVTAHLEDCPACEAVLKNLDARQEDVTRILRRGRNLSVPHLPAAGPSAPMGPAAGDVIAGRYELVERLGEGGMGTVWRADQREPVKRPVAIKLVKPGMDSQQVLARFEAERQVLARMDHPHIARVFDAGVTADGRPYFALELVAGEVVTRFCDAHGLTLRQRLELFLPICRAIQHAHQKGVIHRDIKPNNVLVALVDGKPVPKVIDFGVAKAVGEPLTDRPPDTIAGTVVGTPEYMAPEQADPHPTDVDTRADVYALGGLLYELLTGFPPFSRTEFASAGLHELLRAVREVDPPRPSVRLSSADTRPGTPKQLAAAVRGDLDRVVMKALEKDRDRRYDSAGALARDIERFLADEPVEAARPSPGYRLRKFVRRHRRPIATAAAASVLLLAAAGVSTWLAVEAVRERNEKRQAVADLSDEQIRTNAALADLAAQQRETASALDRVTTAEASTKAAFLRAEEELTSRRAVQSFFLDTVIAAGRPTGQGVGLGRDVTLRRAVDAAAPRVGPIFHGRPLIEATIRVNLAETYLALGDADRAGEQYAAARRLRETGLGPTHRGTLEAAVGVAVAAGTAGRPLDAVRQLQAVVAASRAAHGPDDLTTLRAVGDLAGWSVAANRFADAVPLLEDLVPKFKAAIGPDAPDTLTAMVNLAEAYARDGSRPDADVRRRLAVELLEAVRRSRQETLGADHPQTLIVAGTLADAYVEAGRNAEAVALLEQVTPAREAVLGADHPDTLIAQTALGAVFLKLDRPQSAIPPLEKAVAAFAARPNPDHPEALNARANLAKAYGLAGRAKEAVDLLEGVLTARRRDPGPDHPRTLATALTLARQELRAKLPDRAMAHHAEFLAGYRRHFGADTPLYADALVWVAENLLADGQHAAAESHLTAALTVREARQGDEWVRFHTESLLGEALLGRGDHATAERRLTAAYSGLKARRESVPTEARSVLPEAADRLRRLYAALGKPAEADRWRVERDEVAAKPRP